MSSCPAFELNDEQRSLRDTIREFAESEIAPHAAEWDEEQRFPIEAVRKLGELGAMGVAFPEEYGGLGAGAVAQAVVVEELARVDSSIAVTVGADVSIAGEPILLFGTEAQKQQWLVPLAQGQTLGAFASTEPGGGSDVQAATTSARRENNCWVINGTKAFTTNAGTDMSAFVIVTAQTPRDGGGSSLSAFIVPSGTPGYEPQKPYRKLGWHASDTRELVFADCRVPDDAVLGPVGKGARVFLTALDGGRVGIAAMSVGLAQGALEQATVYAKERIAFGAPIARQQSIYNKLADLKTQIEAARLMTYHAAALKEAGRPFTTEAASAKLFASELAVRAAEENLQIHGGFGYIEESPVPRFYRDAKVLTIGEGTSEILKYVIARQMGLTE
ncbi:MAG TPA: acyl-CoA dehydrogenase family protein [Thermomicrobiales bacterium]|nr:acyl-CoA dehydrogenase family protein [Thermomicrobiales bacterium]